jgi:type IV pilus assembly protein PilC
MFYKFQISNSNYKNRFIRKKIKKLTREIERGKNLTESIEGLFFFPSVVRQIIAMGESSSNLEESMFYIADIYEQEVDSKIEFLTSIIEPFIIIILGLMIAMIIINLYLPIFNIVNAIGY